MSDDKNRWFSLAWDALTVDNPHPAPVREYQFHEKRKWRFDFAWPELKVAVEVEGNAWKVRGGGRHMQDSDLEKYNVAARLGWCVLRFSPGMLQRDPQGCVDMVIGALKYKMYPKWN